MHHFYGLVAKLLWSTAILVGILTFVYHYNIYAILGLATLIVSISYVVGDLYILKNSSNLIASLSDLALTTLLIIFAGPLITGFGIPIWLAFVNALIITAGEWFLHKYLSKHFNEIPELQ